MQTQFPCEKCGAILTYKAGSDRVQCEHCGHENPIETTQHAQIAEQDFRDALVRLSDEAPAEDTRTVKCGGCGASFTFDPHVHADSCPFCGTSIVADTGTSRRIKPAALVPFVLDEGEARARIKDWLGNLWFAPSKIARYARDRGHLAGVYVPHWTFDAETESDYVGQRGTAYQVPRTVTTTVDGKRVRKTRYVTKMRWRPVRGRVYRHFDDVLVVASQTLQLSRSDRLDSWRLGALVPYREDYLSGFQSEAYQVDLETGFQDARAIMEDSIRGLVRMDIGGDGQRIQRIDTRYGDISFKHILLPIWIAAYRYGGKTYQVLVNGQTGEVEGERPYSIWKIAAAVVVGLAVVAAGYFLLPLLAGNGWETTW